MKIRIRIGFLLLLIITVGCEKIFITTEAVNTPQSNYNVFWNDFSKNYPAFEVNGVDWDSVYAVNFPKITSNSTNAEVFEVIKSSVVTLKDSHSWVYSDQFGFAGYEVNKPANYISGQLIWTKYVQQLKSNYKGPKYVNTVIPGSIDFGRINNQDIGYFAIKSFSENASDYYMIDDFLTKFQYSKGIIIDIRENSGGNSSNGEVVASRLTTNTVIYDYERFRNGPKYSDLSDFYPATLIPDGIIKYTNNVVLLTNRATYSAGEDFTLMLRSLPNVTQIGDTTGGGVATAPNFKYLPNGWCYGLAKAILYDNDKKPIRGGIAPQIPVMISKQDSIQGVDRILEKAISLINEKYQSMDQNSQ